MRLAYTLPLAALVLAIGGSASSEIYRWTDEEGRLHFTERLELVPLDQREAAVESVMLPADPDPTSDVDAEADPVGSVDDPSPASPSPSTPRRTLARHGDSIVIPFVRQGTLMRVDAVLNDIVTAPFFIDTGASGISLPSDVARQLGLRVRPDTPHIRVMTANGVVSAPVVPLESVQVEGARVEGLNATISPSMEIGLLGGTFFNNFVYRVDAGARTITLTPNDHLRGGMDEKEWRRRFRGLIDPLTRLNQHLESEAVRRKEERARLEQRRTELEAALQELQSEANRLDVPHAWRQ